MKHVFFGIVALAAFGVVALPVASAQAPGMKPHRGVPPGPIFLDSLAEAPVIPEPLFAPPGKYIKPSAPSELGKTPLPAELSRPGNRYPTPPPIPAEAPILVPSGMQMPQPGLGTLTYKCEETARKLYHFYMRAMYWDKYGEWSEKNISDWNRLLAQYMEYVNIKCQSESIVTGPGMAVCLSKDYQRKLESMLKQSPIIEEQWMQIKEFLRACSLYNFLDPKIRE